MTETLANSLRGKVCLVTGASRGLGTAIARHLAGQGAAVAVHYHQSEAAALALCAELAGQGARAVPVRADLLDAGAMAPLVEAAETQLGPLDVLINNVGPYVDTPFLDLTLADYARVMDGNVRSAWLLAQAAGRRMRQRGAGRIINLAASDYRHRSHGVYGLAKGGVVYLTEALALELAPAVPVFALAPDLIADNEEMAPDFVARAVAATPMRRLVTRPEVAVLVGLLCTPACDMLAGQTLLLDGGRSIPRMAEGGG